MKGLISGFKRSLLLGFVVMLILTGCAKQPAQEMGDAQKSVEDAKAAGSAKYLADDTKKADDSLAAALDEVKAQDNKFALFRNYDKSKQMLSQARADAETLKTNTMAKKEEAKKNAIAGQGAAKASIDEAKGLLAKAPKGKGSKADIEAMAGDLKALEDSLPELEQMIGKEDYLPAIDKAKTIKEKADGVANQVKEAMEKVKAKKGGKKK